MRTQWQNGLVMNGKNKTAVMMGGDLSSACYDGDYGGTRIWCQ